MEVKELRIGTPNERYYYGKQGTVMEPDRDTWHQFKPGDKIMFRIDGVTETAEILTVTTVPEGWFQIDFVGGMQMAIPQSVQQYSYGKYTPDHGAPPSADQ